MLTTIFGQPVYAYSQVEGEFRRIPLLLNTFPDTTAESSDFRWQLFDVRKHPKPLLITEGFRDDSILLAASAYLGHATDDSEMAFFNGNGPDRLLCRGCTLQNGPDSSLLDGDIQVGDFFRLRDAVFFDGMDADTLDLNLEVIKPVPKNFWLEIRLNGKGRRIPLVNHVRLHRSIRVRSNLILKGDGAVELKFVSMNQYPEHIMPCKISED